MQKDLVWFLFPLDSQLTHSRPLLQEGWSWDWVPANGITDLIMESQSPTGIPQGNSPQRLSAATGLRPPNLRTTNEEDFLTAWSQITKWSRFPTPSEIRPIAVREAKVYCLAVWLSFLLSRSIYLPSGSFLTNTASFGAVFHLDTSQWLMYTFPSTHTSA